MVPQQFLFTLVLAMGSRHVSSDCGRPIITPKQSATFHVEEAIPHSWPWSVFICGTSDPNCKSETSALRGILISSEWVLASAYNMRGISPSTYQIHLGNHYRTISSTESGSVIKNIAEIHIHPNYQESIRAFNIALLKISGGPITTTTYIQPVCLLNSSYTPLADVGNYAYTIGYFYSRGLGDFTYYTGLQQLLIQFVDLSICAFNDYQYVVGGSVCLNEGNGKITQYGTPLLIYDASVQRWFLYGTITAGSFAPNTNLFNPVPCDEFIATVTGNSVCDGFGPTTPPPTTTATPAPPPTSNSVPVTTASSTHHPRECPCTIGTLWLDIVFVLDNSNGVSESDFKGILSLLINFVMQIKVSQADGQYSRIAIVNAGGNVARLSGLTSYADNLGAISGLAGIAYEGQSSFNVGAGLVEAQRILNETDGRAHVRNLVIVFSSKDVDCSSSQDEACQVAANMKSDRSTTLMTVALKPPQASQFPVLTFGSPCFAAINDAQLTANLIQMSCKANCFCPRSYLLHFKTEDCHFYGECIYSKGLSSTYTSAQQGCHFEESVLVDIKSSEKDVFMKETAINEGRIPFWIGLQGTNGVFTWDSGDQLTSGDYTHWAANQPNATAGGCVLVQQTTGFNIEWTTGHCSSTSSSHQYYCQKITCDTDNYCPVAS